MEERTRKLLKEAETLQVETYTELALNFTLDNEVEYRVHCVRVQAFKEILGEA